MTALCGGSLKNRWRLPTVTSVMQRKGQDSKLPLRVAQVGWRRLLGRNKSGGDSRWQWDHWNPRETVKGTLAGPS